ncbi:acyl-CoA dehydrogenase family protein [Cryobacterium sp. PH31-L1]|uniref:acyl-CoA dehydrogenase family protein n=1 Tax=Cryobacterium sp. PH31-L1 TaxID=3046199 RepID=UPI0024B8A0E9|nr:acyl-CoA dehydrogenase family protein [Cryobacterium sp. PH31-L1]MDJ0377117.1 acyl-CoA dehydrogenase family protein [Cryobacterium sp. PH31-L1]
MAPVFVPSSDEPLLSAELLAGIRSRAAGYDQANAFFTEDLAELVAAGYLRALVPTEFGGFGLTLQQTVHQQTRLAAHAPATALAVNMHLVWTGVAASLHAQGDHSLDFLLEEAGRGEIFGFGVSEPGNDLVLFGSQTDARPTPDGGYRFTGTKVFTSLSPAWTRLGTLGLDSSDPAHPAIVWAFLDRADIGIHSKDDWNTLGMRASQSQSTVLDGALARPDRVVRRLPVGPNGDPLVAGIFANFEILLSAVYTGIGQRALELAVQGAHARTSLKNDGRSHAQDPVARWRVGDLVIAMDGIYPQIDALARAVDELSVMVGPAWFAQLSGLKYRATQNAKFVVDTAVQVAGGRAYSASSELARLYRDVLAGFFHPSDADSAHATAAASVLGPIDLHTS